MRYDPGSSLRAKSVAKALQAALAAIGIERNHTACLDLVSRMFGFRGWQDLHATADVHPRGPSDAEIPPDDLGDRRRRQTVVLTGEGVSQQIAAKILDEIKPTGGGSPRPLDRRLSTEAVVVRMRTPEAVVDLLGDLAAHMAAAFPDAAVFETDWESCRWRLLVAAGCGLAVTEDGKRVLACYIVQKELVDVSSPRKVMDFMAGQSNKSDYDNLRFVLRKWGIEEAASMHLPKGAAATMAVFSVFSLLDPAILSISRAGKDLSDEFYSYLASRKDRVPELMRFLEEHPVLYKLYLRSRDEDTKARPLFEASVSSPDVVDNFSRFIAKDECPASEVRRVVEALKGIDYRNPFAIFDFTLRVLAQLPPSAIPRTEADFHAMGKRVDHCDALARQGMPIRRIYKGLQDADWVSFEEKWVPYGFAGLNVNIDLSSAVLVAFANEIGRPIGRDGMVHQSTRSEVHEKIKRKLMPRVLDAHSGIEYFAAAREWYDRLREIDFYDGQEALLLAQPLLPPNLRRTGRASILLRRLNLDPDTMRRF